MQQSQTQQSTRVKTILILADRYPIRKNLINIGDRALSEGLYNLLAAPSKCTVISGGWKNFPYYTLPRLQQKMSTENMPVSEVVEEWLAEIFTRARGRQYHFLSWLLTDSRLIDNPLINAVEGWFRKRYSRGLLETFRPFLFKSRHAAELVKNIQAADLILFNGGGLVADHLGHHLPVYLMEVFLAQALGKKVLAVNLSVSINDPLLRTFCTMAFQKMPRITVREPQSARHLIGMGISPEAITTCPDFAVATPPADPERIKAIAARESLDERCIALTVRGDRPVNLEAWVTILNFLTEKIGCRIYFIHTCPAHDLRLQKALAKRCCIHTLDLDHDAAMIIALLRHMGLLISDRYHACLFAMLAGIPVLPIEATTHKTKGLCELTGYPIPVLAPPIEGNHEEILQVLTNMIAEHESLTKSVAPIGPRLRAMLQQTIKNLLNETGP